MLKELKILFIGAGKMATAIAGGLIKGTDYLGAVDGQNITAYDISEEAIDTFVTNCPNVNSESSDMAKVVDDASIVILAVKPQYCAEALTELKKLLKSDTEKLIISIAAGVTIEQLTELSGCKRIARVMPNTPALINMGASGYAVSDNATVGDLKVVEAIFNCSGLAINVPESKLNAVTGVSGSGPAYVFQFIQALIDGGILMGLSRDEAYKLAVQTVKGSAMLAEETNIHPMVLKEMVTSPGGTTAAALQHLKKNAFSGIVSGAVKAAADKAEQLGKK